MTLYYLFLYIADGCNHSLLVPPSHKQELSGSFSIQPVFSFLLQQKVNNRIKAGMNFIRKEVFGFIHMYSFQMFNTG
jgi:hypothetical protein